MPCAIIGNMKGQKGDPGRDADPVVGIQSITQTGTNGKHHYYRITLTDNTYFDFTVTDGEDGIVDVTTDTPSQILTKIKNVDGSGSGLDSDLLDGYDSSYFAKAEDVEIIAEVENQSPGHSKFRLYKWGPVVSFHITGWDAMAFTGVRDEYVRISSVNIPDGFKPPKTVFIDDVFEDQHIVVGDDGFTHVLISSNVPSGSTFNGQVSWITLE